MKSIFHIYFVSFTLFLLFVIVCAGFFGYIIQIQKPDGDTGTSAWPKIFTDQFSDYLFVENNSPQINKKGIDLLHQYQLWLQVLDENGKEVMSYGTDKNAQILYSVMDLLSIAEYSREETIFIGTYESEDMQWNYLIGFPINITKISMYFNGSYFTSGKKVVAPILIGLFLLIISIGLGYGLWITKNMCSITNSIMDISSRTYSPLEKKGVFGDVHTCLNDLDYEIQRSDDMKENTERMREEWIANITHDLKTPLSPIKGYAELLSDSRYELDREEVHRYGDQIQKNTKDIESIINDLKLIYQIDNGMIPIPMGMEHLNRQLKEIVIDFRNNPAYAERDMEYKTIGENSDDIYMKLDSSLFRRGINNLIINALVHNPPDTKITISLEVKREIIIGIHDNGKGLTQKEQEHLFHRYYRSDSWDSKPGGTGLGMAIAKQIIELHGGKIKVQSEKGKGTSIFILFPIIE